MGTDKGGVDCGIARDRVGVSSGKKGGATVTEQQ